jgi:hypothetical protein
VAGVPAVAVSLTGAVTAETVLPAAEVPPETAESTVTAAESTVTAAAFTVTAAEFTVPAAAFTVPAAAFTVPAAAEVTCETVPVTTGTAVPTVPLTPLTTPDNAEPSPPPEELWVAAFAGPASSRPMPNATHSPPSTAPQVYRNTFRARWIQPFIPVTLIYTQRRCLESEHN